MRGWQAGDEREQGKSSAISYLILVTPQLHNQFRPYHPWPFPIFSMYGGWVYLVVIGRGVDHPNKRTEKERARFVNTEYMDLYTGIVLIGDNDLLLAKAEEKRNR